MATVNIVEPVIVNATIEKDGLVNLFVDAGQTDHYTISKPVTLQLEEMEKRNGKQGYCINTEIIKRKDQLLSKSEAEITIDFN